MIFDTHCHGYWHGLKHRSDEVYANMQKAGVTRCVHVGTDLEKSKESLALARKWGKGTWSTAGLHPSGCQDLPEESAEDFTKRLEKFIQKNRDTVVGVGETGLDYYHLKRGKRDFQKKTQRSFFRAQAELAMRLDLPLIIHSRDAAADTVRLIKTIGVKRAVIHCFSENLDFAQELLEWSDDIYISFSGSLTYKNTPALKETARALNLERILVETDAPFLVPQAVRGEFSINEPAFTRHVMDCLKTLRTESGEMVEKTVWNNSNRFFRIVY